MSVSIYYFDLKRNTKIYIDSFEDVIHKNLIDIAFKGVLEL
jgi:hypothetical protein